MGKAFSLVNAGTGCVVMATAFSLGTLPSVALSR